MRALNTVLSSVGVMSTLNMGLPTFWSSLSIPVMSSSKASLTWLFWKEKPAFSVLMLPFISTSRAAASVSTRSTSVRSAAWKGMGTSRTSSPF